MAKTKQVREIKKRDGRIVPFEPEKVATAIFKAAQAVGGRNRTLARQLAAKVVLLLNEKFDGHTIPSVEQIQDLVEKVLMEEGHAKTAKAYILYRDQHARLRDLRKFIDSDELMEGYLSQVDWRVRENSNMTFSLQGLNNHVASSVSSHYWLHKIYPPEVRDAHLNRDFHIHDLQLLSAYCTGWDLRDLLMRGFGGVSGKVESRPPKHLRTALGQIVNFFYTVQGEIAGAVAFSNFDTYLAPFIRYDDLSYGDVKQCLQEFLFNMNVPTRVGFQTPFTNITLDLTIPVNIKNEPVVIGGKLKDETYGRFQKEMDLFNRAFGETMLEGDAKGRVFSFPIPTINITRDFQWGKREWNPLWEMTAKYGVPYFANFVNSDMSPDDARSMCCRLRLDNRELRKRGGGLFGANPLTGAIGVVTINMPRLGYLAKDKEDFFKRLGKIMAIARKSLQVKREALEQFTEGGLYPYCRHYLDKIKESFGEYWRNHFNTIGLLGMNEACLNLLKTSLSTNKGHKFAKETLVFMRERLMDYQNEENQLYNLEATPAEGTSYNFAKYDKEKYPKIIVANEKAYQAGAKPYYTNSTHLPVNFTDDFFEALDRQDDLQVLYSGGTVLHGFIGERLPNITAVKSLIKKVCHRYHLPYFTLTPTFSICPKHGYIAGEHEYCPKCDAEIGYGVKCKMKNVSPRSFRPFRF
ncbi:MAG: ribonucleoside-triphosphate reductase [Parcubacteria group bacterium LiPW_72]|nr:MAG: ribonucleoside-triphosphate reductase [Parcubacteria group bacterium LiPW_72]